MKLSISHLAGALLAVAFASGGAAATLGGPLRLADEGSFFVGGRTIETPHAGTSPAGVVPPGRIVVDQMYVQYRIPEGSAGRVPIVLVHGGGLTGASYETTPDGREGWATYLVRKGHPVYVVDTPGRGRSGFDASPFNEAKAKGDVKPLPSNVLMVTSELAWTLFRFGPSYGKPFADTQFPIEAVGSFAAQGVPFAEATLEGGAMQTAPRALAALLDRIGPAVVVVHSLAGPFADAVVSMRPKLVRAVVNIEGAQSVVPTDAQIAAYAGIPVLELFGDHLDAPVFTARSRLEARRAVVERINGNTGGRASLVTLPSVGIRGNSHMMMQDRNNLAVADYILGWLADQLK
ncbi:MULTISPECIES: lysophospholipase [unclassified Variovorax]|uniref:lysophospholipase n=1 Tax=unclassified Variovorax TaxID=663243 RepID=UPI000A7322FA|nr:lysophospholipase [Variovorax sp. Root434]